MRETGYLQVVIWSGDIHLLKEDVRHIGVKVLACTMISVMLLWKHIAQLTAAALMN
jgi:hypothetical protein